MLNSTTNVVPDAITLPTLATSPEDTVWAKIVEAAQKEGTVTVYAFQCKLPRKMGHIAATT